MRTIGFFIAFVFAMFGVAKAQSDDFQDRLDSSARPATIGNLVFGVQGTCVATLVASDLVVTSAQSVIETTNPESISSIPLSFRYFPLDGGMIHGTYGNYRVNYTPQSSAWHWHVIAAHNLAIFKLEWPIAGHRANPARIAQPPPCLESFARCVRGWPIAGHRANPARIAQTIPDRGEVALLSAPEAHGELPFVHSDCTLTTVRDARVAMNCPQNIMVEHRPVFRFENGALRLVTIVSAVLDDNGNNIVIGANLLDGLRHLRRSLRNGSTGLLSENYQGWPDQTARANWP